MCLIQYYYVNCLSLITDSDDYEHLSTLINFLMASSNGTMLCIDVTIIGDTEFEQNETFNVTFTPENPNDMITGSSTVTITILNGEMNGVKLNLNAS